MSDNDEVTFWFSASLRIKDVPHLHDEILDHLGSGTESHKEGDIRQLNPIRKWRNSIWLINAPIPENEDISKHLGWISNFANANEPFLKNLISKGANIDIYMSYCCSDDDRGFGLDPDLLSVFPKLGIRLEVSIMT